MGDVITKRTAGRVFAALAFVALALVAALAGSSAPSVTGKTHQGEFRRLASGTAVQTDAAAAGGRGLEIKHGARVAPALFDGSVRTLPHVAAGSNRVFPAPERETPEGGEKQALPGAEEPRAAASAPSSPVPDPSISFKGLDKAGWGDGWPPDTVGDVGPTHFIQAVNTSVGIFRKSDGVRLAAFTFNALWATAGSDTPCGYNNYGDPTVVYDPLADRWIVADFAFVGNGASPPYYECIAVSKTSDPPAGGWYLYAIRTDDAAHPWFADYPKMGIWPDGLYMTANMFSDTFEEVRVWAFNRADLESGAAVRNVVIDLNTPSSASLLPGNMRTVVGAPPAGTPNLLVSQAEFSFAFEVFKFHADYSGSGSTFSGPTNVSQASYTDAPATVPSPRNSLDSLNDRLMMQAQYTNIGGTESLWVNHTVRCCGGTSPAGIQWAQLDVTGGTVSTTPVQQQLYPSTNDGLHRWMGSLAVDKSGDMALGYSVSNSTTNPDIRYAGRLASDPLNTLPQTEKTMLSGVTRGTQFGKCGGTCERWGDYSAMAIDPDGCRFWYTQEYYETTGLNWQTRIGSFSFPSCGNGKTDQTISFGGPTAKTFGDPDFTVSATASSGLPVSFAAGGNCTVSGSTVHLTGAGSCTITASQAGNSTYNAAPNVARTFPIAKANQTISFGALADKTYGDPDFTVSATASSGLSVSFARSGNCTISGATVHITGAGSCTVTASQAGNSNFNAASDVPQTFSIAKANQTISFGALADKTYGDADFSVAATASSSLIVTFTADGNCTVNGVTVHITGAGNCTMTASQGGDSNYAAAVDVARSFSIKSSQTITFDSLSAKTYGDSDFTVSATASSGLPVSLSAGGNCTISGSTVHITGAGSCTITASQAGNSTYNAAPNVARTFSIDKASQTISFGALVDKTYGDPDFTVSATASSGLSVSFARSGTCTLSGATAHITGAGSCTVTASQEGNSNFNAAPDVPQTFSIAKANQTISFGVLADKTYGDPDFTVGGSASSGLTVAFAAIGNCTVIGATVHMTGAGSCTVTASQTGDANYNAAPDVPRSFSIEKANQTVTFGPLADKTYGDADFAVAATASSGLAVAFTAGGNCIVTGVTVHLTAPGSCSVTAAQPGNANYNAAPGVPRTFSIAKASQTITFPAIADRVLGAADFDPGATASSGLAVGYAAAGPCSIVATQVRITGAGSCTVTASQSGNSNYAAAVNVARSFSIKANQTITFDPLGAKTFGDADFAVSASASSGLPVSFAGSGNCSVSGSTAHITGAGPCTVTASQAGNSDFFTAPDVARSFSIAKASQSIAFGALAERTYGDPDFNVSATASSGLIVSFAPSGSCTVSGATVHLAGAGSCTLTASQPGNANYNAAGDVSQTFAIAKANQTILFGVLAGKTFGDPDFAVGATASSGLPVAFLALGNCLLAGSTVGITGAGSCTVTALQPGNTNYAAAVFVSQTFPIAKASQTITFGALADKTYGAADFTIAATASAGLAVSFTASGSCIVGGAIVHLTGAGSCTVTASQAGDANYGAAPDVAQSFAIARRPLTPASTCRVPKVVGKSLAAAKLALKQRHCRTGTVGRAYSRKIKKGIVSSQSRRAGRVLPATSKVNLVVSRGRRP
jgi:hypothetical protein